MDLKDCSSIMKYREEMYIEQAKKTRTANLPDPFIYFTQFGKTMAWHLV
jgi:hypothetical protein